MVKKTRKNMIVLGVNVVMHDGIEVDPLDVLSEVCAALRMADDLCVTISSVQFYPEEDGYRVEYYKTYPVFERIRKIKDLLDGAKNSIC